MKKLIPLVLVVVCVLACAFTFTACSNKDEQEPYYGKTYTFTGTATIDWNSKQYRDNYKKADNKDHSQKELLEKYWDDIDWNKTFEIAGLSANDVPHGSVAEFIAVFEETEKNLYDYAKGLEISVSNKSNPKLTITFPTGDNDYFRGMLMDKYDSSKLTMPLCETNAKLAQNKPFDSFDLQSASYDTPGYCGLGVYKTENGHVLTVRFNVQQFVKGIGLTITDYEIDNSGSEPVVTQTTVFQTRDDIMWLYDSEGQSIMYIDCKADFQVK